MAAANGLNMDEDGIQTYDTTTGNLVGSTVDQYAVVCGDANNTLQNVASLGAVGTVLTSNGNGALPSFQAAVAANQDFVTDSGTATSSGGSINIVGGTNVSTSGTGSTVTITASGTASNPTPSTLASQGLIWDDFTYGFSGTPVSGDRFGSWYLYLANSGKCVVQDGTYINTQVYGILNLDTATSTTNGQAALLMQGGTGGQKPFKLGQGVHTYTWWLYTSNLSTSSNRFTYRFGLTYDNYVSDPTEGAWFQQVDNVNSGNFQCKTGNGSSTTTSNSSQAAGTHRVFQIVVNANRTQVDFYTGSDPDNLTLQASNTTNLPTSGHALTPFMSVVKSSGTTYSGFLVCDLFVGTCDFTTARY